MGVTTTSPLPLGEGQGEGATLSCRLFTLLVVAAGIERLVELNLSRRHLTAQRGAGAKVVAEPVFPWMVLLHVATFVGAPLEVHHLRRPFRARLGVPALGAFALANLLRLWAIRALSTRWSVRVVDRLSLGVATGGPYRWVRHPNYVAVALELAALPLVHSAWLTALAASAANALVLSRRIAGEEAVLLADPAYRAAMADKPRFLPRLGWPTS
jgi:methyltransferase